MANKNGLGPENLGPMTGRGMGKCSSNGGTLYGSRRGYRMGRGKGGSGRGFRRGFGIGNDHLQSDGTDQTQQLMAQKAILEEELEVIKRRLNLEV